MHVERVKVKYEHFRISVYSKATTEKFKQYNKITNIPLYFLLQQQFVEDNIKVDIK